MGKLLKNGVAVTKKKGHEDFRELKGDVLSSARTSATSWKRKGRINNH